MPAPVPLIKSDDWTAEFTPEVFDEDHAVGSAFNMLFIVWQHQTTASALRRCRNLILALARRCPEGVGVVQILERDCTPPDVQARKEIVTFLHLQVVKHSSVIYEQTGFKAASIRAVVAGVHALARPVFPHTVHARVSEAAEWHAKAQAQLGRHETPSDIERVVRALRQQHHERYVRV
jgi:hypothetical protein